MAQAIGGYANIYPTPYGNAAFWVVTDLHFIVTPQANFAQVTVTLSGWQSQADADAGKLPLGTYSFIMSPAQIATVFATAQPNVQAAILESDPAWAGATWIPPA